MKALSAVSSLDSEKDGYVSRENGSAIRAKDLSLLLDSWRESYQFSKHMIHRGHVPARSGDMLLKFLHKELVSRKVEYAATGRSCSVDVYQICGLSDRHDLRTA